MSSRLNFIVFILGFMFGVLLVFIAFISSEKEKTYNYSKELLDNHYKSWIKKKGYELATVDQDEYSFIKNYSLNIYLEAHFLFNMVNVICIVFVKKVTNAYAIANTWGRKCNSLYFYGTSQDKYIGIHILPLKNSWQFLCDTLRHIWENRSYNIQWILFSPDDVYVIPENLRYFVATKDYNNAYYFGHVSLFWNQLFNSAQTSYVLSKGSIEVLVNKFNNSEACEKSGKYMKNEDFYLGKYLGELGIYPTESRDEEGRERFHLFTPAQMIAPGSFNVLSKYSRKSVYPAVQGKNCCSPTSISFLASEKDLVYLYSYLLYSVKVFYNGHLGNRPKNETGTDEVWQNFIREELGDVDMSTIDRQSYYNLWALKADHPEEFNRRIREESLGIRRSNSSNHFKTNEPDIIRNDNEV